MGVRLRFSAGGIHKSNHSMYTVYMLLYCRLNYTELVVEVELISSKLWYLLSGVSRI